MFIYNSHTKQKEKFVPIKNNDVKIYVCGPTVYDDAHLGHARSSISFDLLKRVLQANNYNVTFVKIGQILMTKLLKKLMKLGKV